ncbi:MAG: hypothetical protein JSV61_11030, partial [Anaerolineales bacterium]
LQVDSAQALIRAPDNSQFTLDLLASGNIYQAALEPEQPGFYDIQVLVTGQLPDGGIVERTAFLVVQVQPVETSLPGRSTLGVTLVGLIAAGSILAIFLAAILWRSLRKRTG